MAAKQIEDTIKEVVTKHIDKNEFYVFLFGSRVGKDYRNSSDYDIGLYGAHSVPLSVIAKMKDELETYPIPVGVDIVDFSSATDDFKRLALKKVQIWNSPKKSFKLN